MKIRKFTIRNFKSFSNHTNIVDDEVRSLSNFNMLYGYNNSGKSNVLKFLTLIFKPKVDRERIIVAETDSQVRERPSSFWKGYVDDSGFLFHKNDRKFTISFNFVLEVKHSEIKNSGFANFDDLKKDFLSNTHDYGTLEFSGNIKAIDDFHTSEMILENATLNKLSIFTRDANGQTYFDGAKRVKSPIKNDGVVFSNLMALFDNAVCFFDNGRFFGSEKMNPEVTEITSSDYKNWLYNLYMNPQKYKIFSELSEFIRKNKVAIKTADEDLFKGVEKNSPFADFNPEFAKVGKDEIELMLKVGKERFPLSSYGTGIQQLLYILSKIFTTNSRILLIEELEMNFSPKYQHKILEVLRELIEAGKIDQVFFTTHSKYFDTRTDFSIYEIKMHSGVSTIHKVPSRRKAFF